MLSVSNNTTDLLYPFSSLLFFPSMLEPMIFIHKRQYLFPTYVLPGSQAVTDLNILQLNSTSPFLGGNIKVPFLNCQFSYDLSHNCLS